MKLAQRLVLLFAVFALTACQTAAPPPAASTSTPAPAPVVVPTPIPPVPAAAVSTDQARNIANNCFTCHGPDGRSPGSIPSLDVLSAERIATKLKHFKSGAEPSTVMGRHAKAYSEAEIEAVARYIGALNR